MAEGWKQIWEDIRNALRGDGRKPEEPATPPAPEPSPQPPTPVEAVTASATPTGAAGEPEISASPPAALTPAPVDATPIATPFESASPVESIPPSESPAIIETPAESALPTQQTLAEAPSLAALPLEGEATTIDSGASPDESEPEPELTSREIWLDRIRTGLFYAGMVALLLASVWFSGGSKYWAEWTAPKPPASDVIATFEGGQITIADVEAHLKVLVPEDYQAVARTPDTLLAVIEDMVMDELVRRWAAARQPDTDEQFSHTMQHISESLNLESLDQAWHSGDIQVTESEIQDYYNTNKAQFGDVTLDQVREQIRQTLVSEREQGYIENYIQRLKDNASITRNLELLDVPAPAEDDLRRYYDANLEQFKLPRQVVVDELRIPIVGDEAAARQNADDALLKVRSGATFDEVRQAITEVAASNAISFPEGANDPAWDTAVFELTIGELSDVFRAGDAFYIVRLNDLQPVRTQTLDEVRPTVLVAVQQQTTEAWFNANASKTLFTLKGRQYRLGQFYQEYKELDAFIQAEYGGPDGMKQLAEALIERLLLVEDTYDQLLDVQNKSLVDEARLQVLKQMLHQEEIDDKIEVADADMQKYYDDNPAQMALPPQARIRYIRIGLGQTEDEQTAARARADEAYKKLVPGLFQQGADFAVVAQEYSEDPETAAMGGELDGWIGESDDLLSEAQIHPFHEVVLALNPNEISQPFQFGDSLYIVQVIERTESETLTFEQARPYIEQILVTQKHEERLQKLTDNLFKEANVVIYESVLLEYFKTLPTPAPFGAQP